MMTALKTKQLIRSLSLSLDVVRIFVLKQKQQKRMKSFRVVTTSIQLTIVHFDITTLQSLFIKLHLSRL